MNPLNPLRESPSEGPSPGENNGDLGIQVFVAETIFGPFTEAKARERMAEGLLLLTDQARLTDSETWTTLAEVLERIPPAPPTAPPVTIPLVEKPVPKFVIPPPIFALKKSTRIIAGMSSFTTNVISPALDTPPSDPTRSLSIAALKRPTTTLPPILRPATVPLPPTDPNSTSGIIRPATAPLPAPPRRPVTPTLSLTATRPLPVIPPLPSSTRRLLSESQSISPAATPAIVPEPAVSLPGDVPSFLLPAGPAGSSPKIVRPPASPEVESAAPIVPPFPPVPPSQSGTDFSLMIEPSAPAKVKIEASFPLQPPPMPEPTLPSALGSVPAPVQKEEPAASPPLASLTTATPARIENSAEERHASMRLPSRKFPASETSMIMLLKGEAKKESVPPPHSALEKPAPTPPAIQTPPPRASQPLIPTPTLSLKIQPPLPANPLLVTTTSLPSGAALLPPSGAKGSGKIKQAPAPPLAQKTGIPRAGFQKADPLPLGPGTSKRSVVRKARARKRRIVSSILVALLLLLLLCFALYHDFGIVRKPAIVPVITPTPVIPVPQAPLRAIVAPPPASKAPVPTVKPQVMALLQEGSTKQNQGDLDGAFADYSRAIQLDPKFALAFYNRGLIWETRNNVEEAIADYDQSLDLNPQLASAYYHRGSVKMEKSDLDGAIADYTRALDLNPKNALASSNRGLAEQTSGNVDAALLDYDQALAVDPRLGVAYYNRGLIEEQKDQLDAAISDSTKALQLDPKNAQAYFNRAIAVQADGNLDAATADLHQFINLAPKDSYADYARLYLWVIAMQQGSGTAADADLSDALDNNWNAEPEEMSSKIAGFLLGHVTESELLAAADSPDINKEERQHCEAWYFIGTKVLFSDDKTNALAALRQCLSTGEKNLCEYILAQAELQRASGIQTP